MAILQIELKNGKFTSHNGVNVEVATDYYIKGNDWIGEINENGNIFFKAVHCYGKGVRHQLKFKIVNGCVEKILRVGNKKPKVLKTYKLEQWPIDGTIGLTSGYIDDRLAYFRNADFQRFLDEHGITSVRHESANGFFKLTQKYDGFNRIFFHEYLESDGNIKELRKDNVENEEGKPYERCDIAEVTDASWVVKIIWKHGKVGERILYTLDDSRKIAEFPKFE